MKHAGVRVAEKQDLPLIKSLAEKIWPAAYSQILGAEQLEYMLKKIYSPESLLQQMEEYRHIFLLLEFKTRPSGFASYSLCTKLKKAKLQKIYVDPGLQGKGLGKFLLEEVGARVQAAGCRHLQLNVNRYNKARSFYEKQGFVLTGEEDIDIGNGFYMNDYVMEINWADV